MNNLVVITRANFLPLTVVIVLAGLAASLYTQTAVNAFTASLALVGALLAHAAVNAFNNYFDYRSKIDERTTKTPFSGGVEILVKGEMKPYAAFAVALISILGAALIGVYFLLRMFFALLPFVVYGSVAILLYTPVLSKVPALSEIVAGAGFGLMGLGTYVTQTGTIDGTGVAVLVPVAILVAMLLFLNEFPDAEVDKASGRRHLVILLGKKRAARVYVGCLAAVYASILMAVAIAVAPPPVLISFVTLPMAYRAGRRVLKNYDRVSDLIPTLGLNVIIILSTILLLAIGFSIPPYV